MITFTESIFMVTKLCACWKRNDVHVLKHSTYSWL